MEEEIWIKFYSFAECCLFGLGSCTGNDDVIFKNIQSVYDKFSLNNISGLKVVNGTTGNRITVTDKEQVKEIFNTLSKLSIKDTEQPKEIADGYTYDISLYNDGEEVSSIVYARSSDKLVINRHLYIVQDECYQSELISLMRTFLK